MTQSSAQSPPQRPTYILTVAELGDLTGDSEQHLLDAFREHHTVKLGGGKVGIPSQLIRPFLTERGLDYGFRVIAHANLKGGVGKTTSATTLATRAAEYGFKTCILDMDSQASASLAFGVIAADDEPIFIDIWQQADAMVMGSLREVQEGLSLLPSALENGLLDSSLASPTHQKNAVRGVCEVLRQHGFDLVIVDCPPSLGAAVISTICAADLIIVPVGYDVFSQKGLELTLAEITTICETFGLATPTVRILYTFFDRRVKQSLAVLDELAADHGERLLPVPIRTTTQFAKAANARGTVFADVGRNNSKEDYDRCLRHLLDIDASLAAAGREPRYD